MTHGRNRQSDVAPAPLIVVVSGPSGVGKDTLLERMAELKHDFKFHFVVTATTRPARDGEREGVNHHFLTRERFKEMIEQNELLEWAEVYGNFYGVPRTQVREALRAGKHVLCRVDVQGAERLRALVPDAVFVFVMPPNLEVLRERLLARNQDTPESIERRMAAAESEIDQAKYFDYEVVNEDGMLDESVHCLVRIIEEESRRQPPRRIAV